MNTKQEWHDSEYGELPYKKAFMVDFKVTGLKNREDCAFLQYLLLTRQEIFRCHIDFFINTIHISYMLFSFTMLCISCLIACFK